ncbi:hypothetical protein BH11ARM2_BH11ARM2_03790 [soil metagenome]
METITVVHSPERDRYEILDGDHVFGYASAIEANGTVTFPHVEIDPAYEGKGFGSRLVREALGEAKGRGLRIAAHCPFVVAYLQRHPEEG